MNALIFAHTLQQRWLALARTGPIDESVKSWHPKRRMTASPSNDATSNDATSNDATSNDATSNDATSNDATSRTERPSTAIRLLAETEGAHVG